MDGLRGKVVRLIGGENVPVNVEKSSNDMTTFRSADDVLTLLVHLGYLTYSSSAKTVRVPNSEVAYSLGNARGTQELQECPAAFQSRCRFSVHNLHRLYAHQRIASAPSARSCEQHY